MPRQARIDYPGALHHVIGRGIEGKYIFKKDDDKQVFYTRLRETLSKSSLQVYAWCILSNHFHLLIQTGKTSISEFMRRFLTGYAVNYNKRHKRKGYLFQNRYKSIVCDKDEYLMPLIRYIHLNPVKAKMIKIQQLKEYCWTGHKEIIKKEKGVVAVDEVLAYFGRNEGAAQKEYERYVEEGVSQKEDFSGGGLVRSLGGKDIFIKEGTKQNYDERILGDGDFVNSVLSQYEEEDSGKKVFKDIDELLMRLSKLYHVKSDEILHSRKAKVREARSVFIYLTKVYLGYSGTEIGKLLRIKQAASSMAMSKGACIVEEKGGVKRLLKL